MRPVFDRYSLSDEVWANSNGWGDIPGLTTVRVAHPRFYWTLVNAINAIRHK